jgi:hypothetical protein
MGRLSTLSSVKERGSHGVKPRRGHAALRGALRLPGTWAKPLRPQQTPPCHAEAVAKADQILLTPPAREIFRGSLARRRISYPTTCHAVVPRLWDVGGSTFWKYSTLPQAACPGTSTCLFTKSRPSTTPVRRVACHAVVDEGRSRCSLARRRKSRGCGTKAGAARSAFHLRR